MLDPDWITRRVLAAFALTVLMVGALAMLMLREGTP